MKRVFEEQQKNGKGRSLSNIVENKKNNIVSSHHSNAEKKSIIISGELEESTPQIYKLGSHRKSKQSQDLRMIFKVDNINLNSNNSNINLEDGKSRNESVGSEPNSNPRSRYDSRKVSDSLRKDSDAKTPINPFSSTSFNKQGKDRDTSPRLIPNKTKDSVNLSILTSNNNNSNNPILSPLKSTNKSPVKGPILGSLNSNFFQNGMNNIIAQNQNKGDLNKGKVKDFFTRRASTYLSSNFNFESLINFGYVKSFTTLDLKDLIIEEKIYSAELCSVHKGKYLALPVAIKIYNIARLTEEDIVCAHFLIINFYIFRNILYLK